MSNKARVIIGILLALIILLLGVILCMRNNSNCFITNNSTVNSGATTSLPNVNSGQTILANTGTSGNIDEDSPKIENKKEVWKNTPADIKKLYNASGSVYLTIDILTPNAKFIPGETPYFLNQSTKLREVRISENTKFYTCIRDTDSNISGSEGVTTSGLILNNMSNIAAYHTFYFDINDGIVENVYEQCSP